MYDVYGVYRGPLRLPLPSLLEGQKGLQCLQIRTHECEVLLYILLNLHTWEMAIIIHIVLVISMVNVVILKLSLRPLNHFQNTGGCECELLSLCTQLMW